MFIGPYEQAAAWSEESLNGVYRFVNKIYGLFGKAKGIEASQKDLRAMHKCILEVTERIDTMRFNTAVSSMMTYTNYLSGLAEIPVVLYEVLLKLLSPFAPHVAEEMWARLGHEGFILKSAWPVGDATLAAEDTVIIAVQVSGKMRGTVEMPRDAANAEVEQAALMLDVVKKHVEGKDIKKVIVVPNKIINIIV
jgi:leucyl-tRNA synthetase